VTMPVDKLVVGSSRWHGAAFAFFAFGLVAGTFCLAVGPVVGIRLLGSIAMASSALGMAIVAYTWRCEEPAAWESATRRARVWPANAVAAWHRLWQRRSTLGRYWQNVVWAGME
jgi:hypothetical protein